MSRPLTDHERKFLEALVPYMGHWVPQTALPWSDRKSDRARQNLKKRGLVAYSDSKAPRGCSRWSATPEGRRALAQEKNHAG